jgi:NAD(P)-dependent dehydrogenase (short-subunit alcohol dehydrogenase family)
VNLLALCGKIVLVLRTDVSSHTNFERAFEKCLQTFGTLDIVVNNAGIDGEINWETQIKINFFVSIAFLT